MRKLIATLGFVVMTSAAAWADDPLASVYGHTILLTAASGEVDQYWIKEDNTYSGKRADGSTVNGTWEIRDGKACFKETTPEGEEFETCDSQIEGKTVGDEWQVTNEKDGSVSTTSIVASE